MHSAGNITNCMKKIYCELRTERCDTVKHDLQVASYELPVTSYKLRVESL